jgi:hypothetical protein
MESFLGFTFDELCSAYALVYDDETAQSAAFDIVVAVRNYDADQSAQADSSTTAQSAHPGARPPIPDRSTPGTEFRMLSIEPRIFHSVHFLELLLLLSPTTFEKARSALKLTEAEAPSYLADVRKRYLAGEYGTPRKAFPT